MSLRGGCISFQKSDNSPYSTRLTNGEKKMTRLKTRSFFTMMSIEKLLEADTFEVIMENHYDETLIGIIKDKFDNTKPLLAEVERIIDDYMYDEDGNLINGEGGFPIIKTDNLKLIDLGSGYELCTRLPSIRG